MINVCIPNIMHQIQLVVKRLAPEGPRHHDGCAANRQLAWRDLGSLHPAGDGWKHPRFNPVGHQAEIGRHTGLCHLDHNHTWPGTANPSSKLPFKQKIFFQLLLYLDVVPCLHPRVLPKLNVVVLAESCLILLLCLPLAGYQYVLYNRHRCVRNNLYVTICTNNSHSVKIDEDYEQSKLPSDCLESLVDETRDKPEPVWSISSTLLYPDSLLSWCWDRWSSQKPKYQYRDHLVGQLTNPF